MKRYSFLILFIVLIVYLNAGNFSGQPIFTDIPGGTAFNKGQILMEYDILLGSTNSPLDIVPTHDIYFNGNIRFSFTPLDFLQISLFLDSIDPFATHINADFIILKGEGKYQPAIFAGIQNIATKQFISTEGDTVEYDHIPYLKLDSSGIVQNDKLYNYNSPYIAFTKTINNFIFNIGLGGGRFVGFSKWSDRVSIGGYISLFGGIAYHLKLQSFDLWGSAEEDGRDFSIAFTGTYMLDKYSIFISLGGQKLEHWFENSGFQPKFYLQTGVYY
ncbi:hypothetical protein J7L48_00175 [bacterium]|nr:hypothetical protein [bacterium]